MPQCYDEIFKKRIVRLPLEEERSMKSLIEEYGISKSSVAKWCNEFRQEYQNNSESQNEYDAMNEMRKLRKENLFLKKQRHSLRRKSVRDISFYPRTSSCI